MMNEQELNQEEFITWVLAHTLEDSIFRVYASCSYTLVGIDTVEMAKELQ